MEGEGKVEGEGKGEGSDLATSTHHTLLATSAHSHTVAETPAPRTAEHTSRMGCIGGEGGGGGGGTS